MLPWPLSDLGSILSVRRARLCRAGVEVDVQLGASRRERASKYLGARQGQTAGGRRRRRARRWRGESRYGVADRDVPVQHHRRVLSRIEDADEQMVLAIAHQRRVEPHVHALRPRARLQVQERREAVRRLAHVLAAPLVFVSYDALHDLPVDTERHLPDTGARVRRAEQNVARAFHSCFGGQRTAHFSGARTFGLFQQDVGGVEVHDRRGCLSHPHDRMGTPSLQSLHKRRSRRAAPPDCCSTLPRGWPPRTVRRNFQARRYSPTNIYIFRRSRLHPGRRSRTRKSFLRRYRRRRPPRATAWRSPFSQAQEH